MLAQITQLLMNQRSKAGGEALASVKLSRLTRHPSQSLRADVLRRRGLFLLEAEPCRNWKGLAVASSLTLAWTMLGTSSANFRRKRKDPCAVSL